jgi:hypothetical protein
VLIQISKWITKSVREGLPKIVSSEMGHASAVTMVVGVLGMAGAWGRVVTEKPARTQELFHTPYRQKDSRHFKVRDAAT